MNQVFALAGDLVKPKAAHDLMRLIAEGNGEEDEASDTQLRSLAVDSYLDLLEAPKLPSLLLQVRAQPPTKGRDIEVMMISPISRFALGQLS